MEELKCRFEVILFLFLESDGLIHSNEFLTDYFLKILDVGIFSFAEGRYQIGHGVEYVHDFLLAKTKTHVGVGLTLRILVFNTDVQTLLVEIGGSLIIVKILELLGHLRILLETLVNLFSPLVVLSGNEVVTKVQETFLRLLELLLLNFA